MRLDEGAGIGNFAGLCVDVPGSAPPELSVSPRSRKRPYMLCKSSEISVTIQCYNSAVTPFGQASNPCLARATKCACISGRAAPASKPELGRPPQRMPRRSLGGPPSRPPRPPQGPRSGASQRRWPEPCPRRRPGACPTRLRPHPPQPCPGAQRPRLGAGPAAALLIAAPDTPSRRINSSPPHSADGRRMSKQCSPARGEKRCATAAHSRARKNSRRETDGRPRPRESDRGIDRRKAPMKRGAAR